MKIRLRTKKLIYAGLIGAVAAMLIFMAIAYFLYGKEQDKKNALIAQHKASIEELQRIADTNVPIYVLNSKVKKGDALTEDVIETVYVPSGAAPANIIATAELKLEDEYVYFAKTDLDPSTHVTKSLFYQKEDITSDVREAEYSFIEVPTNIKKDSYVDVRIQFPTGDEFIILSKKHIKDLKGITTWMNVREDELLTMSSAVVDAYLEGAKIYAIPYVDEHMQDKSIATYPVKENVQELITESPNVITIAKTELTHKNRLRLENNLSDMDAEQRAKVQSGNQVTDSNLEADQVKRAEQERVQAIYESSEEQQDLIGGSGE